MALGLIFVTIGSKCVYATETDIASGIYEVENDVYHESETRYGYVKNLSFTIYECRGNKRPCNLYCWFCRK